jgi:hypothetical protein
MGHWQKSLYWHHDRAGANAQAAEIFESRLRFTRVISHFFCLPVFFSSLKKGVDCVVFLFINCTDSRDHEDRNSFLWLNGIVPFYISYPCALGLEACERD